MQLLWLQTATTDLQQATGDQTAAQVLCYRYNPTMISEFRIAIDIIQSSERVVPL